MPTKPNALISDRRKRVESVQQFYIRTLRTLNYHGGYSTTKALSLIHGYTTAGVRKRMNAMVECGWVKKVDHDEGLGRSEQLWCITKSGRIASRTENDSHIEPFNLKGFSISDYSPALSTHTNLVQVMANKMNERLSDDEEVKPFKLEVKEFGRNRYVYPDIVFHTGDQNYGGKEVSRFEFYEVELTVKTIKRYKDLFMRIALHNENVWYQDYGFIVGAVVYITTPQLQERLNNVLLRTNSNVNVCLFNYVQIMDEETLNYAGAQLEIPRIDKHQLELRSNQ